MFNKNSIIKEVNIINKLVCYLLILIALIICREPIFIVFVNLTLLIITRQYSKLFKTNLVIMFLSILSIFFPQILWITKIGILIIYTVLLKKVTQTVELRYVLESTLYRFQSKKITYINYSKETIDASKQMINIISMVLILFSSISLICTSIMIGIITYISVNNRTKEIGILRSIGASKKEVAMIFLSEVLITGASSGVIGIFISNILLFLGNIILRNLDIINQKITLNAGNSVSLILINVLLIMLGSVVPSFLASKKNPSLALKE